jgi:hypothetical protein
MGTPGESPAKEPTWERSKMPFWGKSSYKINFVDWSSCLPGTIYKKPNFYHTNGDLKGKFKSSYQSDYTSLEKSSVSQATASDVKQI